MRDAKDLEQAKLQGYVITVTEETKITRQEASCYKYRPSSSRKQKN